MDKDIFTFCFWLGFACEALISMFAGYALGAAISAFFAVLLTLEANRSNKPINVVALVLVSSLMGIAGAVVLTMLSSKFIEYLLC